MKQDDVLSTRALFKSIKAEGLLVKPDLKNRTMSYRNMNNSQKYLQRDVAINQRLVSKNQ